MASESRKLQILLTLKDQASSGLKNLDNTLKANKASFALLGTGLLATGSAIGLFGASAIKSAGELEALKKGLTAVSGSSQETEKQLERLKVVAKLPGLGFKEAISGSINLQAAGFSAEIAERALKSFGNALATVGKGKADLDGVILALSQIAAKGKVSAQEINQLGERLPQIRSAMKEAFGTASGEELQKMGIQVNEFVEGVIAEFEKLPEVTDGYNNSLENLGDSVFNLKVQLGEEFLPVASEVIKQVAGIIEKTTEWTKTHPELTKGIAVLGASITGITIAVGGLLIALTGLTVVAGVLNIGLLPLILTIGAIPIAIGLVVTAGYLLIKNWEWVKQKALEVWNFIKEHITTIAMVLFGPAGVMMVQVVKMVAGLVQNWDKVKGVTITVFTSIKDFFVKIWEDVKGIVSGAIDFIMDKVNSVLNAINNIRSTARNIGNGVTSSIGRVLGVNDAIISPKGDIITTHPEDYLIATKNPGGLLGAGGGSITINVTGNTLLDRQSGERIGNEIVKVLKLNRRI